LIGFCSTKEVWNEKTSIKESIQVTQQEASMDGDI